MPHTRKKPNLRFHPDHRKTTGGLIPLHAERLYELIGVERTLTEVERTVRTFVKGEKPPVVGALLVTCSDESEHECAEVFGRGIVRTLLPSRHFDDKSAFRQATLGGRYEWGAARVAEGHFALAKGADAWKLMVVKINAHVGVEDGSDGPLFGKLARYEGVDTYCGALDLMLAGDARPFARDLTGAFESGELDRIELLNDPARVAPDVRALYAALASARLQARRAMLDIQDHRPATPTLTMILPCVTLNRRGHDTEIVVGVYFCDRRDDDAHDEYTGLGDDPSAYRLDTSSGALQVEDDQRHEPRRARDHRSLIRDALEGFETSDKAKGEVQAALAQAHPTDHKLAKAALATALGAALAVAPVPAALALFAEGAIGIHHTYAMHRLARKAAHDDVAVGMLAGLRGQIDDLEPEQAQHLIELLRRTYA